VIGYAKMSELQSARATARQRVELWAIQSQDVQMHKMWKPVQGALQGKHIKICFERTQWWFGTSHSEQGDNGQT
jgi:hypothetical protein